MLEQRTSSWAEPRSNVEAANEPVAVLAYRSRATEPLTETDLDHLLANAQVRNRGERLTGLLIYDRGSFFQWLEGPIDSLSRVWQSIRRDPRHSHIELLREDSLPRRFFDSWDMRLARCRPGNIEHLFVSEESPQQLLRQLIGRPVAVTEGRWRQMFAEWVIPQLSRGHSLIRHPVVWHAAKGMSDDLAHMMLSADSEQIGRHINVLLAEGAGVGALYGEMFEPAQRILGELWDADRCNDFELSAALAKLQIEVRRLGSASLPKASILNDDRSILMLPQPGEQHGLGLSMSSQLFLRDGWDVTCEFPSNDEGICDLVHGRWFDVLELSLSGALNRSHQLPSMRDTIHAAHAASLNPALVIIVDGRVFFEQPSAYLGIEANAGLSTVLDGVRTASLLLDASTTRLNSVVPLMAVSTG